MKPGIRNKRILYGHPGLLEHRDTYPSFRYYVFLAKGEILEKVEEPDFITYALGLTSPNWWHLECGGILLTPSIVQTACHCIGNYYIQDKEDNYSYAWAMNVWEDRIYSYFGSNLISRMWHMLRPKSYVVYQACRKYEGGGSYQLFDYGLILTKDSVDKKAPEAKISYAPVYYHPQIVDFFHLATHREYMCLLIGHAFWEVEYEDDGKPVFVDENSEYIRWGWRTIMNNIDCHSVSYTPKERNEFFFNYTQDATWVCAQGFKPQDFRYLNVPGDSGGPITCNDVYFSIMSMTTEIDLEDVISYSSPIVLTHFENAAEFRDNFIIWCEEYEEGDQPAIEPDVDDPIPNPELRSTCPQQIVHFPFIILFTTVFFKV